MKFIVINRDPKQPIYLIDEMDEYKLGISHIKVVEKTTQICMANGENILCNRPPQDLITELWPDVVLEFTYILTPKPKKVIPDDIGNKKGE